MLHSQDSFHELEKILRSLQEHRVTTDKTDLVSETDHSEKLACEEGICSNGVQEISVLKVEPRNELRVQDILMEILLHQQLHTLKEYTLNGSSFRVYVLDDTEL